MEAPDKIYIQQIGEVTFNALWKEKPFDKGYSLVYIRKDALLEWLQKEYETNKWFYDTHAKPNDLHTGRCEAYKQVINKIESL